MKRIRAMVVVGLVGVAGLATGCGDQAVRGYLAENGPMYKWGERVQKAVCQLEQHVAGLTDGDKLCPGVPPSITPPPKFPPN